MKIYLENEVLAEFDFDHEKVADDVCAAVLDQENCPFDCEINILITDDEGIHAINKEARGIDSPTDVLSFPGLFFEMPGEFNKDDLDIADNYDPENGLLNLGDIVLSYDRIVKQAEEFGHSIKREYAFLITHSMLHLCGYDHMNDDDAALMQQRQRMVLEKLNISRG
ncbi:MAG: rRNA maturation RNase YbeY [Lachnospiraceae bacterium]|nr:rRNA maturation RNase YbeY [Lachnospiraceae bacterium]